MRRPRLTYLCELDPAPLAAMLDRGLARRLAGQGARVGLALRDFSAERAEAVRHLAAEGVGVVAWLVLDEADGYWCHARNVEAVRRRVDAFEAWAAAEALAFEALAFDVEPDIRDEALLATAGLRLLPRLARTVVDGAGLEAAEQAYGRLADAQRARGRQVLAYGVPFLADELAHGTTRLRRTLGTVAVPGAVHVPMLYSSFARPLGARLVARYARGAQALAVGSTGGGVSAGGLDRVRPLSFDELERDLRLAARHCADLHVFSLEGCESAGFLGRLASLDWTAADVCRSLRG